MNQSVVIGGGPAGLTAAHELAKRGAAPIVLEAGGMVGGIARTEQYKGYRFDVGGHRFFTKVPQVERMWCDMLGSDLRTTDRLSRIHYDGKFFEYPLRIGDALRKLGLVESAKAVTSYLWASITPRRDADTFEEWVSQRFGRRLYERFFADYTEKVWGLPGSQIRAEWAAQRIQDLSPLRIAANAVLGVNGSSSLIRSFQYPRLGPGMMWERFAESVTHLGGRVELKAEVELLRHQDGRVTSVVVGGEEIPVDQLLSSMPISHLVTRLEPAAPGEVLDAASGLRYRALISVGLIVGLDTLFPDQWIYVHNPRVKVGRIQNYTNWSRDLVPNASTSSLGMEYFCDEGDALWTLSDAELRRLASAELEVLGLAPTDQVIDGMVIRQPMAYPLYDDAFRLHLGVLKDYLGTFENLQTMGRNGMHRYNNQDHSMLTGIYAAGNLFGEDHDLWAVNTERSHHESHPSIESKVKG